LEFYRKLETNANKLLQRLRSVCLVQQEERSAQSRSIQPSIQSSIQPSIHSNIEPESDTQEGPKLKDFLHFMKKDPLPTSLPGATLPVSLPGATIPVSLPGATLPIDATYSYPYHRPAPLGAERIEKQDHFRAASSDAGFPPSSYSPALSSAGYPSNASDSKQPSLPSVPGYNAEFSYNYQPTSQVASFTAGAYSSAQYGYPGYPAKQTNSQEPVDKTVTSVPSVSSQYPYQYGYPTPGNPTSENAPADKTAESASQYSYQYGYSASGNPSSGVPPMGAPVQSASQYPYHYGYSASSNPVSGNLPADKLAQPAPQYSYPYGYGMAGNPVSAKPPSSNPTPINTASGDSATGNPLMDKPVQSTPQYSYPYGYAIPSNPASVNSAAQSVNPATGNTALNDTTSRASPASANPPMDKPVQSSSQYAYPYGYVMPSNPIPVGNPTSVNPTTGSPALNNTTLSDPAAGKPPMDKPVQSATQYTYPYGYVMPANPTLGHPTSGNSLMDKSAQSAQSAQSAPQYSYQYGYSTPSNPTTGNPPAEKPVQSTPQYLYQYGYPSSSVPVSGNPALDKTGHSAPQYPYQYGYNPVLNPEVSGPGYSPQNFQHGTTGNQVANPSHSYPYGPASNNPPIVPTNPVSAPTTNLELLSLLDQSVPVPNTGLLVPSSTNGAVTLMTSSNVTPIEVNIGGPPPIAPTFESPDPVSAIPVAVSPVAVAPVAAAVDPLADPEAVAKLAQEVDKFDKIVDGNSHFLQDSLGFFFFLKSGIS